MYLKDVEIFCEVAARRSFSKAAEACQMSQSSASHAVSVLERRLGTALVNRSKRPLELTAAGEVYYEGCRQILKAFREIEDRVQGLEHTLRGTLVVPAIYSVSLLQMDALIRRFEECHPLVDVRLEYRHPDEVYDAVRDGDVEIGIVSFPREGGDFACIPWQTQKMVLVVPPGHPLAGQEKVAVEELEGQDFVTFDSGLSVRRRIDRWLKTAGVSVHVVHAFDNVENVKRAIEIGAGIGLLPQPTVLREVQLGSLAAIPVANVNWTRPLGIVHRRNRSLSELAQRFVALLKEDTENVGVEEAVPLSPR